MMDQVSWSTVSVLMVISSLPAAAMVWAVKLIVGDLKKDLTAALTTRDDAAREFREEVYELFEVATDRERELQRDLDRVRAEAADKYARRDDLIRLATEIPAKLDKLREVLERREADERAA